MNESMTPCPDCWDQSAYYADHCPTCNGTRVLPEPDPALLLAAIARLEREQMITAEYAALKRATLQTSMLPEDELPPIVPPKSDDRWTR